MSDLNEKAVAAAEKEFLKYENKDTDFIAEKYADYYNKVSLLMDKYNKTEELSEDEYYSFMFSRDMEKRLSLVLAGRLLQGLNYEKDKNGLWSKKKKGFFR